ncbi:type II CAAX endopeptidase family protein [Heyndrickxia sporothermodurans]|uniref:CPBP family intramembrane glutamic endopeptidase n=1 Tax=Heyndrickxia sporothermodurans TaxID=46224 RepID=UPI002E207CB7|nr:type II CAAX endopeptidase family protein [Heyndrickxia sporothermodurans]MED3699722.1 type II CAAX endopeptidase family protein [Heyndrickxia sporothermodurans]
MKRSAADIKLILGILLAHVLLYITFHDKSIFWYIYTAVSLLLISYSIVNEKTDDDVSTKKYLFKGIISGIGLYLVFWIGDWFFSIVSSYLENKVIKTYDLLSPKWVWHYFVLVFIMAPGEEIFWRGFIQKRLMKQIQGWIPVLITAILNASVFIYSGNIVLMFAALVGGIVWGTLYYKFKSIPLVVISHLIFDLLLIVVLPLH